MSAALSPSLSLYQLPLQSPTSIPLHVVGSFSRPRVSEVVAVTASTHLSLYRLDDSSGALQLLSSTPLFSEVLALTAFRFLSSPLDFVVLTSDSGFLSIVAWDDRQRRFVSVQQELLGKTGMRRGTPGHYLCVEGKGRALMVAALEKAKMTFILNRDPTSAAAAANATSATAVHLSGLTISSPLEAHKSNVLTLSLSSVDVGYDNPTFVALEAEYGQEERTREEEERGELRLLLSYYELDLGLNHVTRKFTERVDPSAHLLLPVPGPPDGPGGLLIVCESYVVYHPYDPLFSQPAASSSSPFPFLSSSSLRAFFPRRHGLDLNPTLLVIASSLHVQKGLYFLLLQSEHGDLYKVTLTASEDGRRVVGVTVAYFDSIAPSTSLSVLRSGHLFSASESSSHVVYQIVGLEDSGEADFVYSDSSMTDEAVQGGLVFFHARPTPRNLLEVSSLPSMHPILDLKVSDPAQMTLANIPVTDTTPVIYVLCGKGNRSTLRTLRYGLQLTELALSDLPALPTAVFTVKTTPGAEFDTYIIVSFTLVTIVLSVGEQVTEVSDSGLLDGVQSLFVSSLSDGSILQVHAGGLRHVRGSTRIQEWKPPGKKQIALASGNERTVVVCLSGGEIVYFEMDRHGAMIDMYRKDLMNDIAALAIAPVEAGKMRGRWVVVGGYDATVRVFSTDPTSPLQQMSVLAVNGQVSSLLLLPSTSEDAQEEALDAAQLDGQTPSAVPSLSSSLYLYTGLATGVEIRSHLDTTSGLLSDHRKRFLGLRPLQLQRVQHRGVGAVLALADRAWLDYSLPLQSASGAQGRQLLPLSYDPIDAAAAFSSPQCPEGLVAIVGSTLRILTLDGPDGGRGGESPFFSHSVPLTFTPRKMDIIPSSQHLVVLETDHNAYTRRERAELERLIREDAGGEEDKASDGGDGPVQPSNTSAAEKKEKEEEPTNAAPSPSPSPLPPSSAAADERKGADQLSAPYAGEGRWGSCISVHCPPFLPPRPPFVLELDDNEAAFSLCVLQFDAAAYGNDFFLAVGTAKDLQLSPRKVSCGFIHMYAIGHSQQQPQGGGETGGSVGDVRLRLLHKTQVADVPLCLAPFQRRLLAGVGRCVRVYEMGRKRLLRKSETKALPTACQSITPIPNTDRVVVGDLADGFTFLHFSPTQRQLQPFSDSSLPRFLTSQALLDRDTIAGGDKFGNVCVSRLPPALQLIKSGGGGAAVDLDLQTLANRYSKASVLSSANAIAPAHQLEELTAFHLGSVVTAMAKVNLHGTSPSAANSASGAPLHPSVLLCGTLSGGLHVFLPLVSVDEVELLTHLEMHCRAALPSLTGRDHLSFRSAFTPVKGVIDGEMVELFHRLSREKKRSIAEELVSSAGDIKKKLEEIRSRII